MDEENRVLVGDRRILLTPDNVTKAKSPGVDGCCLVDPLPKYRCLSCSPEIRQPVVDGPKAKIFVPGHLLVHITHVTFVLAFPSRVPQAQEGQRQ